MCLCLCLPATLTGCNFNKRSRNTHLQKREVKQGIGYDNEISQIIDFVHSINSLKHPFTIEKKILGTDDGGRLTGYYNRHILTKINVWLGMSNSAFTQQFYFKNGHLVYAEENHAYYSWDQNKGEINRNQYSKTKEEKYYFLNGILIRHMPNHKINVADLKIMSGAIIANARMYIKFLSANQKTVYINNKDKNEQ